MQYNKNMTKKIKQEEKVYSYTVFYEPINGGYNVIFPAISEICTFGEDIKEARAMAEDVLRCHLESLEKERTKFPKDVAPLQEKVMIAV